jgi:hypothetical protein
MSSSPDTQAAERLTPVVDPAVAVDAELLPAEVRELVYGRGLLLLWVGLLGGPVVWALDLQVAYWLVYHACHTNNMVPLYVETVLAMTLCVVPFVVALRMYRRFPEANRQGQHADDRARFMALTGMGLSVLFFVVLIAAAVPRLVLTPCP